VVITAFCHNLASASEHRFVANAEDLRIPPIDLLAPECYKDEVLCAGRLACL